MKKLIIASIILLSLLLIGLYIPKVKAVDKKEDHIIRVVSYNLKYGSSNQEDWKERKNILADQVLTYQPDSIGIQEGDYLWMSDSGLPGLLEGYDYVGVGRDDGHTSGEYTAIFYRSTYEVVNSGNFWLSETPDQPSKGWDGACNRICTWVTLENKETGQIYTHFNTHLDHIGKEAREYGTKLILDKISHFDTPVVLTGDFNFYQDSKNYQVIQQSGLLRDAKFEAKDSMSYGTINWFLKLNFRWFKPIDFCFVSDDFDVQSYRIDNTGIYNNKPVSDHYPVIVDMIIK
ncbi:endonuclease/exonuclease/phosphatase family protein [Acidaminobacter sp. JC074]|uniref:endonuclease/exonuclease/phosphatase family protein n=1 Tax=Acidaminobacter sp. JC074 TaxID=2530199 RepID=UPI001F11761C|nr:endonuclease/exonuclease/phosphatase family protein [Acidaminobacter sp. JC074]